MKPVAIPLDEINATGSAQSIATPELRIQSRVGSPAESINTLTRRNVEIIAQLEQAANAQRKRADKIADAISRFVGSMTFVYLHVAWFGLWIALDTLPVFPESWRIDPFPFTFLTFVVSLEAIFLSTFILISQNHEERLAQRRNHLDLQINLLSEQENSQMLRMLQTIQEHLKIAHDPDGQVLQEAAKPEDLIGQIKEIIEDCEEKNAVA
jgi:uncharacterized membrane protein